MLFRSILNLRWTRQDIIFLKTAINRNLSTIDEDELQKFLKFKEMWWDTNGPLRALHNLNNLRIPFVQDGLIKRNELKPEFLSTSTPLNQISILDVGCGAGILTVGLTKLGYNMTGLDPSPEMIKMAKLYANKQNLNIKYEVSSIEEYAKNNTDKYDAVVSSEVIEHVTQKAKFVEACVKCLKPSGSIFITTINKTLLARVYMIFIAENIFRVIPKGTHEFKKLCDINMLQELLEENNCKTLSTRGAIVTPFSTWHWIPSTSTGYALHAVKLKQNDN